MDVGAITSINSRTTHVIPTIIDAAAGELPQPNPATRNQMRRSTAVVLAVAAGLDFAALGAWGMAWNNTPAADLTQVDSVEGTR